MKEVQLERMSRPRPGRPSAAQQAQRHDELLAAALEVFLDRGYETTTIDEIARDLGMSKRTVYTLYEDKAALFKAVVLRAIKLYAIPAEALERVVTDDLRETLAAITRLRIENISNVNSIRLRRILDAHSFRFPELGHAAFQAGAGPTIWLLAALFRKHTARGEINVPDPEQTAAAFLSLVLGAPMRLVIGGNLPSDWEVEERTQFALDLFFNGVAAR